MKDRFLSSEGRIGRVVFIVRIVLLALLVFAVVETASRFFADWHEGEFGTLAVFFGIVAGVLCSMAGLMQLLKRLRDMGKGAFLSLLMLVPGVNVLFLLYLAVAPSKS